MSNKPNSSPKPVVITFEISAPDKKNVRRVLVSGAPQGEMPELRAGTFAERHALLDALWVSLMKREPQIVTLPAPAKAKTGQGDAEESGDASDALETNVSAQTFENAVADAASDETPQEPEQAKSAEGAPLIAAETNVPADSAAEYQTTLPLIENDPTLTPEATHG